jgi:hypothetical protein
MFDRSKIINFLTRDSDITYYDEWHYMFITLTETFKILLLFLIDKYL